MKLVLDPKDTNVKVVLSHNGHTIEVNVFPTVIEVRSFDQYGDQIDSNEVLVADLIEM